MRGGQCGGRIGHRGPPFIVLLGRRRLSGGPPSESRGNIAPHVHKSAQTPKFGNATPGPSCTTPSAPRRTEGGGDMPTKKHYAHLDFEARVSIENYAIEGRSLAYIARELDVDATSVSRELKRDGRGDGRSAHPALKNRCAHRKSCSRKALCGGDCERRKCSACGAMCREGGRPDWGEQTHGARPARRESATAAGSAAGVCWSASPTRRR